MLSFLVTVLAAQAVNATVTHPHPGVTLARTSSAALVVVDLCAAGVSVRATAYGERKATPSTWANKAGVGVDVAINADFFDFPGATLVINRARGAGQDWQADKQFFEVRSYWEFGPGLARWQPNAAVAPAAAPAVTEVVGGHIPIIQGGQSLGPGFNGDPTITTAHRRTGIGMSADRRTLFLYVSDANQTGATMVATMQNLAGAAGAPPIDVATNEDGGGSSQMYVRGVGALFETGRLVANHLGIHATGSGDAV
ncbi:MAG: phosphodiester glycosidase family protein, partial [Myxococcales bacterium]|nr:phosphodiester glycosidase family protein [Myxococcales bacterium]